MAEACNRKLFTSRNELPSDETDRLMLTSFQAELRRSCAERSNRLSSNSLKTSYFDRSIAPELRRLPPIFLDSAQLQSEYHPDTIEPHWPSPSSGFAALSLTLPTAFAPDHESVGEAPGADPATDFLLA